MKDVGLRDWARGVAEQQLEPLGRRWRHVVGVAELANRVGGAFGASGEELTAAAYLHDVGYAPGVALTGFHPLDGARFVRAQGHERLARLVAHHSGARHEAKLRRIEGYEDEFPFDGTELDQALTYCDLTTGPDGSRVTLATRFSEITERYGPDHVVARAINLAVPEIEEAIRVTERRMLEAGVDLSGTLAMPR